MPRAAWSMSPKAMTTVPMVATPADFHGTPSAPRSTAPKLGEHTDEILDELRAGS